MIRPLFSIALVLFSAACATAPTITSRPVSGDTSGGAWFVRLDRVADQGGTPESRFAHPANLSESDVAEILSRVLTQPRVGAMDDKPSPEPFLSSQDLTRLAPSILQALQTATPSEWVTFYSAGPTVISGGLFLKGGLLHVVVANHHAPAPTQSGSLDYIRANPLSPWKGQRRLLSFDPARFVADQQTTWMAGPTGAPASELILRHQAFLAFLKDRPADRLSAVAAPPIPSTTNALPPSPPLISHQAPSPPSPDAEDPAMKAPLHGLRQEIESLRQRLDEQARDMTRLQTRLIELETLLKNQPAR